MPDIIALFGCLDQCADKTTLRQLYRIVLSLLTMTGRVTMLGISRWAEKGGSYRTVQRFFNKALPWSSLLWLFVRQHVLCADGKYIVAGDETVVTKAGKRTYGLDRFFSSIFGRPVAGLAFFAFSLVSIEERRSSPILVEQRIRREEEKQETQSKQKANKASKAKKKGKPGRPKGSKNKDKTLIEWTPELLLIQTLLKKLVLLLGDLPISYLVMDGHFGNTTALQMVLQASPWQLISKLRNDSALYFLYDGPQKKKGPRRRYHVLLCQMRQEHPQAGILDLKADFRGRRYAIETLNLLPESPNAFISDQIVRFVASLGRIHRQSKTFQTT